MQTPTTKPAAYDAIAAGYDLLTADWDYEAWIAAIQQLALRLGLAGNRVLDVACGTGSSFLPLLARGYDVTACDRSAAMAAIAARRARGSVEIDVADMRALPEYGAFDLITCLDDAINHLAEPDEVVAALAGMRRNLAPAGLIVFDVNTLVAYRDPRTIVAEDASRIVIWHGEQARLRTSGGVTEVRMQLLSRRDDGLWSRSLARWPHRHYGLAELRCLVARADLSTVAVRGQRTGGRLETPADEATHPKLLIVAGHRSRKGGR